MTKRHLCIPVLWTRGMIPVSAVGEKCGTSPVFRSMAGIYQEIIGKTAAADEYYGKSGSGFGEIITGLFE